jgi:hypothetical protein
VNDVTYSGTGATFRVRLDPEIMRELVYGGVDPAEGRDDKARATIERTCSLRELQVYRLMRSIVGELNQRMKGRRERFKLVEEGEGLFLEFIAS